MNYPKVFINTASENWVVDRFIKEWNRYNYKQEKSYRGRKNYLANCSMDMGKNTKKISGA